jgi:hypothetical protein
MLFKKSLLLAALLGATLTAQADVAIVGSKIVVKDTGAVTATFLGSDAGYNDVVIFDNPVPSCSAATTPPTAPPSIWAPTMPAPS